MSNTHFQRTQIDSTWPEYALTNNSFDNIVVTHVFGFHVMHIRIRRNLVSCFRGVFVCCRVVRFLSGTMWEDIFFVIPRINPVCMFPNRETSASAVPSELGTSKYRSSVSFRGSVPTGQLPDPQTKTDYYCLLLPIIGPLPDSGAKTILVLFDSIALRMSSFHLHVCLLVGVQETTLK